MAGTKLSIVKEEFAHSRRLMEEHGLLAFLAHMIQMEKNVSQLMGEDEDTNSSATSSATKIQVESNLESNPHAFKFFSFQKMFLSFILREYEPMKSSAEQFFHCDLNTWIMFYSHTNMSFYGGVVSFWIYRQTNDPIWASRGNKAKVRKQ